MAQIDCYTINGTSFGRGGNSDYIFCAGKNTTGAYSIASATTAHGGYFIGNHTYETDA
jgi:hypothetical protein